MQGNLVEPVGNTEDPPAPIANELANAAVAAPEQPTSEPLVPAMRSSDEPNILVPDCVEKGAEVSGDVPQSTISEADFVTETKDLQNHQRPIKAKVIDGSSHGDSLASNMRRCIWKINC
ncbi:hypothetical protein VNO78_04730 [Psophocarpus tetragonolobus]|uniref:Uncharacterized protein n=1 Tax=Psophocarpus tetragonolobus TaxID=3891 RepID=A0AAN9TF65_PSOTE